MGGDQKGSETILDGLPAGAKHPKRGNAFYRVAQGDADQDRPPVDPRTWGGGNDDDYDEDDDYDDEGGR
jgi:hypothetical protein